VPRYLPDASWVLTGKKRNIILDSDAENGMKGEVIWIAGMGHSCLGSETCTHSVY
jgi:hypothetical protein